MIWSPGDNGPVKDWNTDPILAEVEKATNTDIEMVKIGWDVYTDQINAAIASGKVPDIIGVIDHNNRTLLSQFIKDGVIAPIEGDVAAAAPNIVAEYEQNPSLAELKVDGKSYFQPISWGTGNEPNMGLIHVRKDLLDKYGLAAPETFDDYFKYLQACKDDGSTGVVFSASEGVGAAINAFAGAYGLPMRGWVKLDDGSYGYYAVQPKMKDALLLFRKMVADGLVDPSSWESNGDQARAQYVTGKACSFIFNGGGHIGRIQNDLTLANPEYKEWLLPALDGGQGSRGYTTEPMFWGVSMIGNLQGNNPVAAARVLNYLASPEGYKLTAVGVEGTDYQGRRRQHRAAAGPHRARLPHRGRRHGRPPAGLDHRQLGADGMAGVLAAVRQGPGVQGLVQGDARQPGAVPDPLLRPRHDQPAVDRLPGHQRRADHPRVHRHRARRQRRRGRGHLRPVRERLEQPGRGRRHKGNERRAGRAVQVGKLRGT